jgi:hypothetical protein
VVVRRVRFALAAIVVAQGVLFGLACAALVAPIGGAIAAGVTGAIVAAGVIWRSRAVYSLERAALWVEERDRSLQYALVTAVDARYAGRGAPGYSGRLLRRAAFAAIAPATVAVALAVAVNAGVSRYVGRRTATRAIVTRTASPPRARNRLAPLVARIAPPAYSHLPTREVREPTSVASLVGSVVTLRGSGDTSGLRAVSGERAIGVASDADGWHLDVVMPAAATVVRLTDREYQRLVVLAPIPDEPPVVELVAPARDSTMRQATGTLPLVARASDDIGLADGYFEVIITGGEEETGGVQGRTLTIGRVGWLDARSGTLTSGLNFDALHVSPGNVVSIRAVARDGNTVNGPGVGTSETRTFRLATKEEYDSIAVEGAPPPGLDSSYLSQRMIVIATQDLLKRMRRRPPVERDTVVGISRRLGARQENLKNKVYQLLYGGDEGSRGEAMPPAERVLFDTAYHAMTDASMSLAIAEPKEALPRELVALAALDSVRKMQHRLYLRGQPPTIVVNVPRVRLTGTEKPDAGARAPAVPADTVARRLVAELAVLGGESLAGRAGVADSLVLMQVAAYGVSPALASAFGDAVTALKARQDPAPALARARRMLGGGVQVDTGQTLWVTP